MITNENILISLLVNEENGIAATLEKLHEDLKKEEFLIPAHRKEYHGKGSIYHDYNEARKKMMMYLFKINKKHPFMNITPIYEYADITKTIGTLLLGLKIAKSVVNF